MLALAQVNFTIAKKKVLKWFQLFYYLQDFDTFLLLGTSGDNAPGEVIDKAARRLRTCSSHVFTNPEFSICNCFLRKKCFFDKRK